MNIVCMYQFYRLQHVKKGTENWPLETDQSYDPNKVNVGPRDPYTTGPTGTRIEPGRIKY